MQGSWCLQLKMEYGRCGERTSRWQWVPACNNLRFSPRCRCVKKNARVFAFRIQQWCQLPHVHMSVFIWVFMFSFSNLFRCVTWTSTLGVLACNLNKWERSYIIYIFKATSALRRAGTTGIMTLCVKPPVYTRAWMTKIFPCKKLSVRENFGVCKTYVCRNAPVKNISV
jgi:hypothetical protein